MTIRNIEFLVRGGFFAARRGDYCFFREGTMEFALWNIGYSIGLEERKKEQAK